MGPVVSVQDAPPGTEDSNFMAREIGGSYGKVIGNFERLGIPADFDAYRTGPIIGGETVYVALFPSFFVFDEIFDKESGTVTIEVFDNLGASYPYEEVPLSNTAEALALINFTALPGNPGYTYRVRPSIGLQHGEYTLIDTGLRTAGPAPVTLDGEKRPPAFDLLDVYSQPEVQGNYTDITIGGSKYEIVKPSGIVRLGFLAADSEIVFEVTSGSAAEDVQRVVIDQAGDILQKDNLTLTNGDVNFRVNTPNQNGMVVLRFPPSTAVVVSAKHVGSASNVATYSCIDQDSCPAATLEISDLPKDDIVALELSMSGTFDTPSRAVYFEDSNTGANYGSFQRVPTCGTPISSVGVIFGRTTSAGKVELQLVPPNMIPTCQPKIGITLKAVEVAEHLGIVDELNAFESSVRSFCEGQTCSSGSLVFEGVTGEGKVSNLALAIQGFAGTRLTLSLDSAVFYNSTLPSQICTDDPIVLEGLTMPPITGATALSIAYEIVEASPCPDRQSLVLGVVGYSNPTSDLALIIGLSVAAAAMLLVGLLTYSRSKVGPCNGSKTTALKTKEAA